MLPVFSLSLLFVGNSIPSRSAYSKLTIDPVASESVVRVDVMVVAVSKSFHWTWLIIGVDQGTSYVDPLDNGRMIVGEAAVLQD